MVERIDIGKTVADGTRQRGVALEQRLLSSDRQYRLDRVVPFGLEPREDRVAQADIRVASVTAPRFDYDLFF